MLYEFLDENPAIAKTIIDKIIEAATAREAARKARELSRKKTGPELGGLPGNWRDVLNVIHLNANCLLLRGIRRVVLQNRDVTARPKLFCLCVVKS